MAGVREQVDRQPEHGHRWRPHPAEDPPGLPAPHVEEGEDQGGHHGQAAGDLHQGESCLKIGRTKEVTMSKLLETYTKVSHA